MNNQKDLNQNKKEVIRKVPYGFINIDNKLIKDDSKEETIIELFNLVVNGYSIPKIGKILEGKNILSPSNNSNWSLNTIRNIISNDIYKDIVGEETFEKAYNILNKKENSELRDLIYCNDCKAKMYYEKRKDTYNFFCSTDKKLKTCSPHTINKFYLERYIKFLVLNKVEELNNIQDKINLSKNNEWLDLFKLNEESPLEDFLKVINKIYVTDNSSIIIEFKYENELSDLMR